MTDAPHAPVLLAEVIEALAPAPGDVVIDATFGAGGYTRAILATGAAVIALDRDPTVQPHADAVAADFPDRFQLVRTPFSGLAQAFADSGKARLDGAERPPDRTEPEGPARDHHQNAANPSSSVATSPRAG